MSWSSAFPKGIEESVEAPGSEPKLTLRLGNDRSFELFHYDAIILPQVASTNPACASPPMSRLLQPILSPIACDSLCDSNAHDDKVED